MSRYHRENPDQPIQHDWLEGVEHVGFDKAASTPHPDWVTCCACQADMAEVMELWSEVDAWPDFLNAGCCCQECFDKLKKM